MSQPDLSKLRIERSAAGPLAARPRRRLRRLVWALLLSVLLGGIVVVIFRYTAGAPPAVEQASVTLAYPSQAVTLLNATGYVVAQRKASVASKATGRLEWLGVAEGSRAAKGEVIARLESLDVKATRDQAAANVNVARANIGQAKAEREDAERQLRRTGELLAQRFVSQAAYDEAQARFDKARAGVGSTEAALVAAEANLRAADVAVEQTLIRAPFDGVVLTKNANVGDTITPFSSALDTKGAVVTMADMSTLEVEADVSESNLQKVKVGQPCEIELDAIPGVRFEGRVNRVVPTVDRSKATVMTKVSFTELDSRILPDMSARVAFLSREIRPEERAAIVAVNPAAITTRNGRQVVFVVHEEKAVETPVQLGPKLGDLIEVKEGVRPDDKVVLAPPPRLQSGMLVQSSKR
ncbi:MAG: efflux RND transporter periplasmic adaptor subunit [Proteobacteria bacterium]|nr:MAG: efflux RND transporter periplasmic adaptor subunit [Pseudomonadota bacterium]